MRKTMDQNERQIIDELFGKLRQAEAQSGPRDPQAESYIREQVARQPAAPYLMAQAIVIQEQALAASQARIKELEQQAREQPRPASGGFLSGLFGGGASSAPAPARRLTPSGQPGIGDPRVAAYANPHQQQAGGGFLAGAMQTAMGVAGGVLIGSALASAFSGDAVAEEPPVEEPVPEEIAAEEDSFFGGEDEEL
jgi:uncharacterized protein